MPKTTKQLIAELDLAVQEYDLLLDEQVEMISEQIEFNEMESDEIKFIGDEEYSSWSLVYSEDNNSLYDDLYQPYSANNQTVEANEVYEINYERDFSLKETFNAIFKPTPMNNSLIGETELREFTIDFSSRIETTNRAENIELGFMNHNDLLAFNGIPQEFSYHPEFIPTENMNIESGNDANNFILA